MSCTRLGLTAVSLSEGHEERMDRHIILVFTWEDRMEDWVIICHPILFRGCIRASKIRVVMEGKIFFEDC